MVAKKDLPVMGRAYVKKLGERALEALKVLADAEGLVVVARGGTIGDSFAVLKFEFIAPGSTGQRETEEIEAFRQLAGLYGLKPEDLGREVVLKDGVFKLAGINPRAERQPFVIARVSDGRKFRCRADVVVKQLAPAAADG
jgi:hypothetical protein